MRSFPLPSAHARPRPARGAAAAALLFLLAAAAEPARSQAVASPTRPAAATAAPAGRWTAERARAWYDSVGWQVGGNYVPSTASNELEMWQAATWDPTTIDRELGYAQSLGMNTMRVFLHDLAYRQDPAGFLRRVDQFLAIADRHRIRPMLVLFDAVWDPFPKAGKQREPYPFLHNSTWAQSPGRDILVDTLSHERVLRPYVAGVVRRFARDRRVLAWDIFNEPDNINRTAYFVYEPRNKDVYSLALLRRAFAWARAAGATQPLTAAPWKGDYADTTKILPISKWMLENSDVITFHSYDPLPRTQELVASLKRYGRPIICTEYMARPIGSTFRTHLPYFAEERVGAINWGFINGRSQTIYPWETWTKEYTAPPTVWFHDIFQTNGTPYDTAETSLIRAVTRDPSAAGALRRAADSAAVQPPAAQGVTRAPFGTLPDGRAVELFTVGNGRVDFRVTNYGGIITHLRTRDRAGRLDDVVLGYDSLAGYLRESPYFGAIVGRFANRIARGRFTLDGRTYTLAVNNGANHLHGGTRGFDKVVWTADPFQSDSGTGVALRYVSRDGEEGYPGTLTVDVRYTLTPRDELVVDYHATTDKATPVNLSQHTYWNLAGTGAGGTPGAPLPTNAQHLLTLNASGFTPVDSTLIPTGRIAPVEGTPFDFRTPTAVGARIGQQNEQLRYGGGYDHNWVLDRGARSGLVPAARLADPSTGRTIDISTTEPGIQFYSGNFLDGKITWKAGRPYPYRSAVVLETQHFPDSPNQPSFPSTILRPGETYRSRTVFTFGTM